MLEIGWQHELFQPMKAKGHCWKHHNGVMTPKLLNKIFLPKFQKKKKKKYGPFARQHFLQEWAIRGICKFIFRLSLKTQRKKKIIKKEKRMTSCINLQFHFLGFQIMDTKGSINLHNYILNIKQRDTDLYNPRMPSSCAILFKAENMPL